MSKDDKKFDLIITDINMPNMTGIELIEHVRSSSAYYSSLPILVISSENESDTVLSAIVAGASDYLLKPFTPNGVVEKLKKVLKVS